MDNYQRSIYAAYIQSCMALQKPISYMEWTTLNEKFGVATSAQIPTDKYPAINCAVIGNGGHKIKGTGQTATTVPAQHESSDAALFNHLPFVLREPSNDLTIDQMANYRLRTTITVNNQQYVAYYAKVLDTSNTVPSIVSKVTDGDTVVTSPFVPSVSDLSPTPVDLTVVSPNLVNNELLSVTSLVNLVFTAQDQAEFINACSIIYGDPVYSNISEIGICSGIDVTVQGQLNGTAVNYTESVGMMVLSYMECFYPFAYLNNGLTLTYNVGATEPLLKLASA